MKQCDRRRQCDWSSAVQVCMCRVNSQQMGLSLSVAVVYFAVLDCGEPEPLPNGSVSFNSTVYGSMATHSCAEGYELTAGNPLMQCQADGEWSSAVPRCEREFMSYTYMCKYVHRTSVEQ